MQVTKGTRHMHEHCVPGSVSSSPAWEPGNKAITDFAIILSILNQSVLRNKRVWLARLPHGGKVASYHYRDLIRGCGTQLLYRQQNWLLNICTLHFRLGRLWWVSVSTKRLLRDNARINFSTFHFHWSNTATYILFVLLHNLYILWYLHAVALMNMLQSVLHSQMHNWLIVHVQSLYSLEKTLSLLCILDESI